MDHKSRTLKRLGVAGLGAVIAIGTPAVGFIGVAAAANPAGIQFVSQVNGAASTLGDGTNNPHHVKLSAVETQLPTGAGNPDVASVKFSYQETAPTAAANPTVIDTDNSAPYTVNWDPPNNGTFNVIAEPLATGGGSAGSAVTNSVVVDNTSPTVHVTSPTDGSTINFSSTADTSYIGVTGTRSNGGSGLPAISISTQLLDVTKTSANYGLVDDEIDTDAAVAANASPAAGASQAWDASVPVAHDCPTNDTCDVIVDAVAGATTDADGATDEAVEGTLAAAPTAVTALTVTPSPASGTTNTATTFTVTAKDTAGDGVPGIFVTAAPETHGGTITVTPTTTQTGGNGTAIFKVTDTAAESTVIDFSTEFNGSSVVPGTDFTTKVTYTTSNPITPVITNIVLSKTPSQSVYASQDYSATDPKIQACFTDQTGAPFTTGTGAAVVNVTRTLGNGNTSTVAGELGDENAATGCYPVTLTNAGSYPGDAQTGADKYDVYIDKNGLPGFQQGADLGDTTTVNFAPAVITFNDYPDCTNGTCITQETTGTVDTIKVGEAIGTSPAGAGTTLHLSLNDSADFPTTQPSGATRVDNTDATCVTGADGTCTVNVSDGTAESATLTATDGSLSGDIRIDFRNNNLAIHSTSRGFHAALYPTGTGGTDEEDFGAPGTVMIDHYRVLDSQGDPLADVPVTANISGGGFFTTYPGEDNEDDYNQATFAPPAAGGAEAGSLKSLGTSYSTTTSPHGWILVATSIGRDAGFDNDGQVLSDITVTDGGNTVDAGNPASVSVSDTGYTWTTNTDDVVQDCALQGANRNVKPAECAEEDLGDVVQGGALNGASVKIFPAAGFTFTGNHTSGYKNSSNPATEFYVQATDQFGNLVGTETSVSSTGAGNGNTCDEVFSAYNADVSTNDEPTCKVTSGNSPTTASPTTVTDTWLTQSTAFVANTDTSPGEPAFVAKVVANTDSPTQTDSFTVDLYSVDISALQYAYNVLPDKVVKTGTTVHDEVTVTDQYSQPVQGLFVTFQRSGPGNVDTSNEVQTNGDGTGSDNFSSAAQGNATETIDVYDCDVNEDDCSGIPLSESVNTVGFDGVPTISASPASLPGAGTSTISGVTRPGASVQLFAAPGTGTNFTKVGSTITADTDGSYSFSEAVGATTTYRVIVDTIQVSAAQTVTVTTSKITEKPTLKLKSPAKGKLKAKATTNPKLKGATVKFYVVSSSGHRTSLGEDTTNGKGKASATFKLKKGKTFTLVAKVTGLPHSQYTSEFSNEKSKKVKG